MKFNRRQRRYLIGGLVVLLVAAAALAIFFVNRQTTKKTDQNLDQPDLASAPASPLISQQFPPRDPNLNNEQNLVKDYLANHLSELSPTKEVLGGKFYLTDIKFSVPGQADIAYEDGHIALAAAVRYELDPRTILKVTNFTITKEN